jgi:hypothetical protein
MLEPMLAEEWRSAEDEFLDAHGSGQRANTSGYPDLRASPYPQTHSHARSPGKGDWPPSAGLQRAAELSESRAAARTRIEDCNSTGAHEVSDHTYI